MQTVYITSEDPSLNYSTALNFGKKLVGVFPPGQVHLNPQIALYRARSVLSKMIPGDFLALAGDPVKIGICVTVAAEVCGTVRMLRWDRQTQGYIEVPVDFTDTNTAHHG